MSYENIASTSSGNYAYSKIAQTDSDDDGANMGARTVSIKPTKAPSALRGYWNDFMDYFRSEPHTGRSVSNSSSSGSLYMETRMEHSVPTDRLVGHGVSSTVKQ